MKQPIGLKPLWLYTHTHTQCKSLRKSCHPEFISGSNKLEVGLQSGKMLKQVQHDIKKAAFTLAEVLITLTIIGIVASITMPTLIQQKNNNEIKAKVKKVYTTLTNAYSLTAADEGVSETDLVWNNADIGKFYNAFKKHLNIKQICDMSTDDCFSDITYKRFPTYSEMGSVYYPNGDSNILLKMSDGTSLYMSYSGMCWTSDPLSHRDCVDVYVDINGEKTPNVLDVDLFNFTVDSIDGFKPEGYAKDIIYKDSVAYLNGKNVCETKIGHSSGCGGSYDYEYEECSWKY